jgi:hypothetical protein
MNLLISKRIGILWILVWSVVVLLPVSAFAECRVVEYPDHNEVVCDDDAGQPDGQPRRRETPKLETTRQREFVFYSPVRPTITRITISADLSPFAIATPGETLLSYRAEVLKDKVYTPSSATFVYDGRTVDNEFIIREESVGDRISGPSVTNVKLNDKKNHLLLMPFKAGCASDAADGIYLKMNRFDGGQLYYQIVIPACLSTLVQQSIAE